LSPPATSQRPDTKAGSTDFPPSSANATSGTGARTPSSRLTVCCGLVGGASTPVPTGKHSCRAGSKHSTWPAPAV
jgi:hypothetical protein